MTPSIRWTPIESRIAAVLADGRPHTRHELMACLHDDQALWKSVLAHLERMRKKLRQHDGEIICQLIGRSVFYRRIRLFVDR